MCATPCSSFDLDFANLIASCSINLSGLLGIHTDSRTGKLPIKVKCLGKVVSVIRLPSVFIKFGYDVHQHSVTTVPESGGSGPARVCSTHFSIGDAVYLCYNADATKPLSSSAVAQDCHANILLVCQLKSAVP